MFWGHCFFGEKIATVSLLSKLGKQRLMCFIDLVMLIKASCELFILKNMMLFYVL